MDASGIEPTSVLGQDGPKLTLVPHQDPVQQLAAQGADEPFDMSVRVGRAIGRWDATNAHGLGKPDVEGRPAGDLLAGDFRGDRSAELPEHAVIVVEEELRRPVECRVADLLVDPGLAWVLGHVDVHDPAAAQLQDDEDVQGGEADRVLDAEVAGPDGLGLVLQERAPRQGIPRRPGGLDHVLPDRGLGVLDAELELQLERDAILAVLGMVAGDAPDEPDVPAGDARPPGLGLPGPEVLEPLLLPLHHGLGLHDDERVGPARELVLQDRPEQPVEGVDPGAGVLALVDR